jgi:hypothetical protein
LDGRNFQRSATDGVRGNSFRSAKIRGEILSKTETEKQGHRRLKTGILETWEGAVPPAPHARTAWQPSLPCTAGVTKRLFWRGAIPAREHRRGDILVPRIRRQRIAALQRHTLITRAVQSAVVLTEANKPSPLFPGELCCNTHYSTIPLFRHATCDLRPAALWGLR